LFVVVVVVVVAAAVVVVIIAVFASLLEIILIFSFHADISCCMEKYNYFSRFYTSQEILLEIQPYYHSQWFFLGMSICHT
jgi:hypothetical protein